MSADNTLIAGIDIGGTKIAVGVTDAAGRVLSQDRNESEAQRGPKDMMKDAVAMVRECVRAAGESSGNPSFIGVACPGPLSQKRGVILDTPNMPGWEGYAIIDRLKEDFPCPAVLENDANAAALGEALFGAGRGKRFVAYFTISTGVGGGFVQDGAVLHGVDGNAAEFGHQTIIPIAGRMCGCARPGHLEAYASGTSIARRVREALEAGQESILRERFGSTESLSGLTAGDVAEAAREGDPFALRIWKETGFFLGLGIVNVVQMFNPDVVVLGGGVTRSWDLFIGPTLETVYERLMPAYCGTFTIEKAALGDLVGVMGAVGLARAQGLLKVPEA
jgi:glucokinase